MMTNEEAMVFLDNLEICIKEHPVVADWLVEIANRKTENSSEKLNNCEPQTIRCPKCGRSDYIREFGKDFSVTAEEAGFKYKCINCNTYIKPRLDRKTENSSEFPNNCDTCKFELYCPEMCEECCEWDNHYEPKTEPQEWWLTENSLDDFRSGFIHGYAQAKHEYESKTEPQTEYKMPYKDCEDCETHLKAQIQNHKTEPQINKHMTEDDAYYIVFKDLTKDEGLFTGKYDAKYGNKHYMYGINSVMEYIAYRVGQDCFNAFNEHFTNNMIKSEEAKEQNNE